MLRFVSDVPESIWVQSNAFELTDRAWLRVLRGTEPVQIAPMCECTCDRCPCDLDCGSCPTTA